MRKRAAALGSAAFFAVAPGSVVVLVPWLLTGFRVRTPAPFWLPARLLGAVLLAGGAAVLVRAFAAFVVRGAGTPAPAAAPRHLVVSGLYRHVRNPMYVALIAAVLGEALLFGQLVLLLYAAVVWVIPACYVRWREEPVLARRFGAEYEQYRRAVPAWLPRLRPWRS